MEVSYTVTGDRGFDSHTPLNKDNRAIGTGSSQSVVQKSRTAFENGCNQVGANRKHFSDSTYLSDVLGCRKTER